MNGITITEHVDTNDSPCFLSGIGGIGPRDGCYSDIGGKHNVWYSSVAPAYVIQHEWDHAAWGMRHSPWDIKFCSLVTSDGNYVKVGEKLCISRDSMDVYDLQGNYLRDAYQLE